MALQLDFDRPLDSTRSPWHHPRALDPLDQLKRIYRELDAAYSGWTCPGRADCCQFGKTGKEPQLWPIEWKLLKPALRANPKTKGGEKGDCPALDPQTRRCRAYEARPFGCRTFFCELAEPDGNPRAEMRRLTRELADLAERDQKGAKLLPLRTWLSRKPDER